MVLKASNILNRRSALVRGNAGKLVLVAPATAGRRLCVSSRQRNEYENNMALYTPRGLKIRLPVDYAFALIARLHPKITAFKVLKMTEAIESIPPALTFATGLALLLFGVEPLWIGISVFLVGIAGGLMIVSGRFIPGMTNLGMAYSYGSGYGVLLIILIAAGWFLSGWQGVLAFFISKFLSGAFNQLVLGSLVMRRMEKAFGDALTVSELNFFSAYRIYARQLNKSDDIHVDDDELNPESWQPPFTELKLKWPEIVRRFSEN
jgi:hypothetical protein